MSMVYCHGGGKYGIAVSAEIVRQALADAELDEKVWLAGPMDEALVKTPLARIWVTPEGVERVDDSWPAEWERHRR